MSRTDTSVPRFLACISALIATTASSCNRQPAPTASAPASPVRTRTASERHPATTTAPSPTIVAVDGDRPHTVTIDLGSGVTLPLVLIPAGAFTMGDEGALPVHAVTISKPFYLGRYEVTREQWQAVLGDDPSDFVGEANLPVESVSWHDCQAFLQKLHQLAPLYEFALPTEAQWEHACRAGSPQQFDVELERRMPDSAWYEVNARGTTHPVGLKQPNAWGLYDMHGNVWEWCADFFGDYPADPCVDPSGPPSGEHRALRGGSWNFCATFCRAAARNCARPDERYNYIGLRVAAGTRK